MIFWKIGSYHPSQLTSEKKERVTSIMKNCSYHACECIAGVTVFSGFSCFKAFSLLL